MDRLAQMVNYRLEGSYAIDVYKNDKSSGLCYVKLGVCFTAAY